MRVNQLDQGPFFMALQTEWPWLHPLEGVVINI